MYGADMKVGSVYAFRERRTPGTEMLKVTYVDAVGRKGKIKIRFESGPHPGLEEHVTTRNIVCPWGQRGAVERDEQRAARLAEHAASVADETLGAAASAALEATGEPGAWCSATGAWFAEDELQRIIDRAGLDGDPQHLHIYAYRDRHGHVHLPLDTVVEIARAFAAAEPQTVTEYLDDEEQSLRERGAVPGDRWYREYLREKGPAHALVRRWAGPEQGEEQLRKEIARLRSLVTRAAYELKDAGRDQSARRLERALAGQ